MARNSIAAYGVLLLVVLSASCLVVGSAQSSVSIDLGSWDLPTAFTLSSPYIRTVVSLEEDDSRSTPTLSATAHGPFPVAQVTRGIVSQSGNNVVIRNWDAQDNQMGPTSAAPSAKTAPRLVLATIWVLCLATMFISLTSTVSTANSSRNGAIGAGERKMSLSLSSVATIAVLGLVLFAAHTSMGLNLMFMDASGPWIEITIAVPTGTAMGSLQITLANGALTASSVTVGSIKVDLCSLAKDELIANYSMSVSTDGLIVSSSVDVCAPGVVTLSNILQASAQVSISAVSSNASVAVSTVYYTGSYDVSSASATPTITGTSCTTTTSTSMSKIGTCGSPVVHTAKIRAATAAALTVVGGCATGFTGDAPMGDNVPSSPAVSAATSVVKTLHTPSMWWVGSNWTIGRTNGVKAAASGAPGIDVPVPDWQSPYYYWLMGQDELTFRNGLATQVAFTVIPPATNSTYGAPGSIVNVTMAIVKKHTVSYWHLWPYDFSASDSRVLYTKTYVGPFRAGNTVGVSVNEAVTLNQDVADARLWIRVTWSTSGLSWTFQVKNIQVTSPIPVPSSFVAAGTSEAVPVFKMPAALDPNPRGIADCPHRATSGLSNWHDASIWPGGIMPTPNQEIVVPEGLSVLISSCSLLPTSFVYYKITVPATSKLIFSDANINMRIRNLLVEGELHMGSPTCRLNGKINIEFVGEKTIDDNIAPGLGSKGIGVAHSGSIDVHGRQFHPTWTRLSATVFAGSDTIYLQDSTNWEVGQSVVIATSIYQDFVQDQNEVRVIKAIGAGAGGVGSVLQLDSPLSFYHYGGSEYQTEVGLLSRRIVFSGDAQSDAENFGGHTRVLGEGRFSGVQTRRMGQTNVLGKYPFHFHAMGPSNTSFIRDCSIWDSYFRCIAIHATNDSQALRNVVFNATAHCYYLEDGIEEGNVINYNLAVKINTIGTPMAGAAQTGEERVSSDDLILPADGAAAGFYITNAYNTFIGNAASGGWAGFSFPNLPRPIGISRNVDIIPQARPTYIFNGNTAHSSGYSFSGGGCFYVGGLLQYDTTDTEMLRYSDGRYARPTVAYRNGPQAFMVFNNTKVWMCGLGISHWGNSVEVTTLEAHETIRPVQLFGESWLDSALVNAKSASLMAFTQAQMGFQFYDTYVQTVLSNIVFRGFKASVPPYDPTTDSEPYYWPDQRVITSLIHSDHFKPQGISATKAITFQNCDRSQYIGHKNIETGASRYFNFVDWDGSFGGTSGVPQIIGSGTQWWNYTKTCVWENNWGLFRCPQGSRVIINLDYIIPGLISLSDGDLGTSPSLYLGQTYLFGPGISPGQNATFTRNTGITGVSEIGWYFHATSGTPKAFSVYQSVNPTGHWVMGAWKYATGTTFTINIVMDWGRPTVAVTQAASFSEVLNGDGTKYFFDGAHLYIKMINNQADIAARGFTRSGVTIYDVNKPVHYDITATCANANGQWCPSSYVHPTQTWS